MTTTPEPRTRRYDASTRRAAAQTTRHAILESARREFLAHGYAGATMAEIARGAGIALDTVYAAVGRKPKLFRLLVEAAISGQDGPVPAEQRDYVKAMQAEPDPTRKLRLYAAALRAIQPRLAPLFRVLQAAAPLDADLHAMWQEIAARRATNMRLLASELAATGRLQAGMSVATAADILWSLNAPEFYLLLVEQRGWSPAKFEAWLAEAWQRLLLQP
jgi:AcrR family transcriptional regulator